MPARSARFADHFRFREAYRRHREELAEFDRLVGDRESLFSEDHGGANVSTYTPGSSPSPTNRLRLTVWGDMRGGRTGHLIRAVRVYDRNPIPASP